MGSIAIATVSPFFRYFGGSKPMPTPAQVPVAIRSPGSSSITREMVSTYPFLREDFARVPDVKLVAVDFDFAEITVERLGF